MCIPWFLKCFLISLALASLKIRIENCRCVVASDLHLRPLEASPHYKFAHSEFVPVTTKNVSFLVHRGGKQTVFR